VATSTDGPQEEHHAPTSTAPERTEEETKRTAARRRALLIEVVLGVIGAGAVAATGVSGLPVWAVIAYSAGITAATALATSAAVGPESDRVISLWGTVAVLVALLVGTLVYVNQPATFAFVNYVNDSDVTLSPVAGAPPRSDYNALVLVAGEEHSAYCYVVVKGETWLFFKNGWAPRSDFHLPPEAHYDLPGPC
jgi:hypothetical protein